MSNARNGVRAVPIDYRVRPMRRQDFTGYREVTRLAIGKFERSTGLDESSEVAIAELSRRSIWFLLGAARLFRRPIVDVAVATRGAEVVGTATVLWLPRTAYVAGVATSPERRGQGIASRILAHHAEQARRFHRRWMALDVERDNASAIRVYQRSGYRDAARFVWFVRPDLPPKGPSPPSAPERVDAAVGKDLAARLDAGRPNDYRDAFPAGPRVLIHNEYVVRSGRAEVETWKHELPDGSAAVMRACFVTGPRMAAYFPMSTAENAPPEAFLALVDAASEWFRPRGPARVIAVVPATLAGAGAALEQKGFSSAVSTVAMLAPVAK